MDSLSIWHEFNVNGEGVSVTTYSQEAGQELIVEDETWYTWDEVEELRG